MSTLEKRLETIIKSLSPEEQARIEIEDIFRSDPLISPADQRRMLASMSLEEGRRYNAYIDQYSRLKAKVVLLQNLANGAKVDLLERDRILWYHHVLEELVDRLGFPHYFDKEAHVGKALLVGNRNVKPGKTLEIRLGFATLRLGVWGRNRRPYPPGNSPQVVLHEKPLAALELYSQRIRETAADMKVILRYIVESAQAMDLEVLVGLAFQAVESVRQHDRPAIEAQVDALMEQARKEGWEGTREDAREALTRFILKLPDVQNDGGVDWPLVWQEIQSRDLRGAWNGAILPVDKRWALVWEDLEESAEAAQRIREHPVDFIPSSWADALDSAKSYILEHLKGLARKEGKPS